TAPTTMRDRPTAGKYTVGKDLVHEFETCAICQDNGSWLGCIKWKYSNDKKGVEKVEVTSTAVANDASKEMKDAKKKFDDNHTKAD
ncbi:unnamed protein product, partial [marine sediment metagenome]